MAMVGIISFIPVPPTGQSAVADVSKASSTLQIKQKQIEPAKTAAVEAVQAAPAPEPVQTPAPAPEPVVATPTYVTGTCSELLAAAGIPATKSVTSLIAGESGCNPNVVNKSSGACGIAQELPCGKSGCNLGDGVCQLKWMQTYVNSRYGGWDNAYNTWLSRSPHWY